MTKRLERSRKDAVIGGVCGGLGQYLGLDPVWIRLFFIVLALANGLGALIYVLLWIVMPPEGKGEFASSDTIRTGTDEIAARARAMGDDLATNLPRANRQTGIAIGAALIFWGVILFLQNLKLWFLTWLNLDTLWPLLLIFGGLVLILRRTKGD